MRATPPSARMSAGTRSSAITAAAPASSAIRACSALTTSMITPPLSISARPALTRNVPVSMCTVRIARGCDRASSRADFGTLRRNRARRYVRMGLLLTSLPACPPRAARLGRSSSSCCPLSRSASAMKSAVVTLPSRFSRVPVAQDAGRRRRRRPCRAAPAGSSRRGRRPGVPNSAPGRSRASGAGTEVQTGVRVRRAWRRSRRRSPAPSRRRGARDQIHSEQVAKPSFSQMSGQTARARSRCRTTGARSRGRPCATPGSAA